MSHQLHNCYSCYDFNGVISAHACKFKYYLIRISSGQICGLNADEVVIPTSAFTIFDGEPNLPPAIPTPDHG